MAEIFDNHKEGVHVIPSGEKTNHEPEKAQPIPSGLTEKKGVPNKVIIAGLIIVLLAVAVFLFLNYGDNLYLKKWGQTEKVITKTAPKAPLHLSTEAMLQKIDSDLDLLTIDEIYNLDLKVRPSKYDEYQRFIEIKEAFIDSLKYGMSFYCETPLTDDVSFCERIGEVSETKYLCLARLKKDSSYCDEIIKHNPGPDDEAAKNLCMARFSNDASFCGKITTNDFKEGCFAEMNKDKLRCMNIQDNAQKQNCIAKITGDISACDNIEERVTKYACLALAENDISYCREVIKENFAQIRLNYIKLAFPEVADAFAL